jgi:hypothetical protein
VHADVAETVDSMLRGHRIPAQVRDLDDDGDVRVVDQPRAPFATGSAGGRRSANGGGFTLRDGLSERRTRGAASNGPVEPDLPAPFRRVYPFGISRKRLEQAIRETGAPVAIAEDLSDADTVMTLRAYFRRKPQALRDAESRSIPIYVLKTNTVVQMEQGLLSMSQYAGAESGPHVNYAMQEAEDAITGMLNGADEEIELSPQNAYIRRLQHQMAQRYNLSSRSHGREPQRRVVVSREEASAAYR